MTAAGQKVTEAFVRRILPRAGTKSRDGWCRVRPQQPGPQRAFQSGLWWLGLSLVLWYQPVHGQWHRGAARLCLPFVPAAERPLVDLSPLFSSVRAERGLFRACGQFLTSVHHSGHPVSVAQPPPQRRAELMHKRGFAVCLSQELGMLPSACRQQVAGRDPRV